jgi:hypothetical protein
MYTCCVLDGNIHIFTAAQRDDPYQKKTNILSFKYYNYGESTGTSSEDDLCTTYFFVYSGVMSERRNFMTGLLFYLYSGTWS